MVPVCVLKNHCWVHCSLYGEVVNVVEMLMSVEQIVFVCHDQVLLGSLAFCVEKKCQHKIGPSLLVAQRV